MKILSQQTSAADRKKFWNKTAAGFKSVRNAYSTTIYGDGEWRLFRKYFGELKDRRLLKLDLWNEVNNTSILNRALEAGVDVSAIDISDYIVTRARENFKARGYSPRFVCGDMRAVPFSENYFDFVYTMGTIEHVPDPERAMQEIFRVLKPGGVAVIGVPYRFDPFGRAAVLWLGNKLNLLPYGEEKCFSWRELVKLIQTTDFSIVARSGAYFIPWPLRFGDMFLHQKARPLTLLFRPFLYICKMLSSFNFLLKYNSLIAIVVKKP